MALLAELWRAMGYRKERIQRGCKALPGRGCAILGYLLLGYVFLKFDTHKMVGLPNHPGWNLVSGVKLKP